MLYSTLKKAFMVVVSVTVFATATAFASPAATAGCKTGKFPGTYTRVDPPSDVFGDGSVIHQYIFQLTLNSDGTASQTSTGFPDFALNTGTGSSNIGSWLCRNDGNLVVTLLSGVYLPTPPGPNNPLADLSLFRHSRGTLLFRIDDDNTLTRIQARNRSYLPADDPTNPAGGHLGPLVTAEVKYSRLAASDADLLLP